MNLKTIYLSIYIYIWVIPFVSEHMEPTLNHPRLKPILATLWVLRRDFSGGRGCSIRYCNCSNWTRGIFIRRLRGSITMGPLVTATLNTFSHCQCKLRTGCRGNWPGGLLARGQKAISTSSLLVHGLKYILGWSIIPNIRCIYNNGFIFKWVYPSYVRYVNVMHVHLPTIYTDGPLTISIWRWKI